MYYYSRLTEIVVNGFVYPDQWAKFIYYHCICIYFNIAIVLFGLRTETPLTV